MLEGLRGLPLETWLTILAFVAFVTLLPRVTVRLAPMWRAVAIGGALALLALWVARA
jgi:hypothetical protein